MGNWYTTRERVKRALKLSGSDRDSVIDDAITTASGEIEELTHRRFIPTTETRSFTWPQGDHLRHYVLHLDHDLLTLTALTKGGDDLTVIAVGDVLLEPSTLGPPFDRIEIDRSTSVFYAAGNTPQRAIRVTGDWAFSDATKTAGALAEALDDSETDVDVTDAGKVDVGDTILVESERMFVTGRSLLDTAANLNGALTADVSEVTVTVDDATKVKVGEVIQVNAEKMLVESISGNDLSVQRAFDGSVLATHDNATDVYVARTLTVERGANGTTAVTHDSGKAVTRYTPPGPIIGLCQALAIFYYGQDQAGWTATIGGPEQGQSEAKGIALGQLRAQVQRQFRRRVVGAV